MTAFYGYDQRCNAARSGLALQSDLKEYKPARLRFRGRVQRSGANNSANTFLLLLAAVMLLGACSVAAVAQQITATITGTVTDAQHAVIPGATVKATNLDTGVSQTTASDNAGVYSLRSLPVGRYTLRVNQSGFKEFVQNNLVLTVDQTLELNIAMEVGAVTESITVDTAPPLVNTTSAELGRTVQPEEITELPLVNRDVYSELSLTPGVQSNSGSELGSSTPNFQSGQPPAEDLVINGGYDANSPQVSYYLDGSYNNTAIRNYGNQLPDPDAIQEFRVETANFSAQYGRLGSAVVTTVTRSGTNQFHGSLFEVNRNTDFNATPWGSTSKAPYHRNNFGGTIGGPIVHNKAFFFFSYGGLRQVQGTALTGAILPTANERLGDFTDYNSASTSPTGKVVVVDLPGTKTQADGVNASPNCQTAHPNCLPTSALDPTAANLLSKYIPLPNTYATNAAGSSILDSWTGYFTAPLTDNEYLAKYDHEISAKDHLSLDYFYIGDYNTVPGMNTTTTFAPYSTEVITSRQQNAIVSETHTIGAATLNQAWITFTQAIDARNNTPAVSIGSLGSSFTVQGPPALPSLTVTGFFTPSSGNAGTPIGDDFYAVRDIVSTTKGRHTLSLGGEVSLDHIMTVGDLINFGTFTFSTSAPNTTKLAMSDFVTGTVYTMEQDVPYVSLLSTFHYGLFVQDAYRVTPRLTINAGLRYDIDTPPVDSNNRTDTFVPGVQSTVVPAAPLGLLFPGDPGVGRGPITVRWRHISPRLGLAWDPFGDGKTAIRAGAGIFYGSATGNEWNHPANANPFASNEVFTSITSLTNVYGNPASFPNGDPFPYIYNPKSPQFLPNASVSPIPLTFQYPYTYQFNLAVERQLPGDAKVTVAYVGTLNHDAPVDIDANYPAWAPGATTSAASVASRRPYSDNGKLGQILEVEPIGTTSYHSLQISVEKRMSHSYTLNGFYVLSENLENMAPAANGLSGAQDYDALSEEVGPTANDQRHIAAISGIWSLNYFHGSNSLLKQVVNGWEISSIASLHSGLPLNVTTGTSNNAGSYLTNRPNLVPGVSAFLSPHRLRQVAAAEWFNPAAFTPNEPGTGIGPGGADGNTPQDYLRDPGYRDVDLGLFRTFSGLKGIKLQLRAEAINAFNLVSLGVPNSTESSALFGHVTGALANSYRQIQLGGRLTF